jgi:hypothetical protein
MVANVFAVVLLGIALTLVAAHGLTQSLFRHEGDLYARHGSTTMARLVYFVAGVSPVFPTEKGAKTGAANGSASASGSTSGAPPGSAAPPAPK